MKKLSVVMYVMPLLFWLGFCLFIYERSYVTYLNISPDSSNYMREALNLLSGNGMNSDGLAGGYHWFATWPVGYPAVLAAVAALLHTENIYFCSRIVSCLSMGLILVMFILRYGRRSWMYAFALLNIGFLWCMGYAWSETLFYPFLVLFAFCCVKIYEKEKISLFYYILLTVSMCAAFLSRYIGAVTVLYSGLFTVYLLVHCLKSGERRKLDIYRIMGMVASCLCSVIFIVWYLWRNIQNNGYATGSPRSFTDNYISLTKGLFIAFVWEFIMILPILIVCLKYWGEREINLRKDVCSIITSCSIDAKIFLTLGFLYYVSFIIIRFRSTMDGFGTRFFSPGTLLLSIGVLSCITKDIDEKQCAWGYATICGAIFYFFVLSHYLDFQHEYNRLNPAYPNEVNKILESVENIPSHSVVVNFEGDYRVNYFRPDISFGTEDDEKLTVHQLIEKYPSYEYVVIQDDEGDFSVYPTE